MDDRVAISDDTYAALMDNQIPAAVMTLARRAVNRRLRMTGLSWCEADSDDVSQDVLLRLLSLVDQRETWPRDPAQWVRITIFRSARFAVTAWGRSLDLVPEACRPAENGSTVSLADQLDIGSDRPVVMTDKQWKQRCRQWRDQWLRRGLIKRESMATKTATAAYWLGNCDTFATAADAANCSLRTMETRASDLRVLLADLNPCKPENIVCDALRRCLATTIHEISDTRPAAKLAGRSL